MNHLAHAFLAANTPASIIGSLAGDFVRGPLASQFEPALAAGIRLHRQVDAFTDAHDVTRRSRKRFIGAQRRVAGIALDVYYDYFLSQHWEQFCDESFAVFCERIYTTLRIHQPLAPTHFRQFIPRFIEHDLLSSCCTLDGVSLVIEKLANRWQRKPDLQRSLLAAGESMQRDSAEIQRDFLDFFPQLITAAETFKQDDMHN